MPCTYAWLKRETVFEASFVVFHHDYITYYIYIFLKLNYSFENFLGFFYHRSCIVLLGILNFDKKWIESIAEILKISSLGVSIQTNLRRFADLTMVSFLVCTLEALWQLSLMTMFPPNFILNYDVKCDIYYLLIVNVEYSAHLQPLHKDLPFLSEKIVISGHKKLVCTITIKKIIH